MAVSSGLRFERLEEACASAMFMRDDLGQVLAADADVERFLAQARALAVGAQRRSRGSG